MRKRLKSSYQGRRVLRKAEMKARHKRNYNKCTKSNSDYYKKQEDMLVNIGTIFFLIISVLFAFIN